MKMFAIDFLSDTFGGKNLGNWQQSHIAGK